MILKYWPAVFLLLALLALAPVAVQAQEPRVRVFSTAPYPLLIDGEEVTQLPAISTPGSQVCIVTTLGYLNEQERLAFKEWSHGSTDVCVTLEEAGDYTAKYQHEVLLQIRSQVKDYRASNWVPRGSPTRLSVPEVVEERPGLRYLFEEWTGGESPFQADNLIVPTRPLILEVRWTKQYFLELVGPGDVRLVGGGWHKDLKNVVLKAPATAFSPTEDERLQFARWQVISNPAIVIPNFQSTITAIKMDDSHTLEAVYETAYRVLIETPEGVLTKDWLPQGKEVLVDTSPVIVVTANQERLSFSHWEGLDLDTPKGIVTIDKPLTATAIYDREFMVTVKSPYGASGEDWYKEGETATIEVPENPDSIFFVKKFFKEYPGYTSDGSELSIPVTGPLTITAAYATKIDVKSLVFALLALSVIGVIYLITQRQFNLRKRRARW